MRSRRHKRVGVDVDGVLGDLLDPLFAFFNARYGTQYGVSHMVGWDVADLVPDGDVEGFWRDFGREVRVHDVLRPYDGAVEGMRHLAEVADVYVVTSHLHTAPTWVYDRDRWVMEHFGVPKSRMVHASDKYVFAGAGLIDDKPQNVIEWQEEYPDAKGVLWRQRYNEGAALGDGVLYEARDWPSAVALFAGRG